MFSKGIKVIDGMFNCGVIINIDNSKDYNITVYFPILNIIHKYTKDGKFNKNTTIINKDDIKIDYYATYTKDEMITMLYNTTSKKYNFERISMQGKEECGFIINSLYNIYSDNDDSLWKLINIEKTLKQFSYENAVTIFMTNSKIKAEDVFVVNKEDITFKSNHYYVLLNRGYKWCINGIYED